MGLHVAQMTGQEAMHACFLAVTATPARILGLEGYGLTVGCNADFVLLDAGSTVEAIRLRAARRAVVRRGAVISEAPAGAARLNVPGRPERVNFRLGR
jgi:cytosine deaminase